MKTIVIPDVHHKVGTVDKILKFEKADRAVFLGDWFDDFDDGTTETERTAKWLVKRMADHPEDIFLWGNHDISYAFPSRHTWCTGYTEAKCATIRDIMMPQHWDRFVWYHREGAWLLTHAGLGRSHTSGVKNLYEWLADEAVDAQQALRHRIPHWVYGAGLVCGGPKMYGGIVWNRPVEFIPIDGVNQLFGHTPSDNVWKHDMHQRHDEAHDSLNYCIDTYLRFYATFEGDKFGLKDFRKRNQVS